VTTQNSGPRQEAAAAEPNMSNPMVGPASDKIEKPAGVVAGPLEAALEASGRFERIEVPAGTGGQAGSSTDDSPMARLLDDCGVTSACAQALGWSWCEDSRQLSAKGGGQAGRGYAGVVGPLGAGLGAGWFFRAVPEIEGGVVMTSERVNVLAALSSNGSRDGILHLAEEPLTAALILQDGHTVAWFNGPNGWRAKGRQLLPELAALGVQDTVVLHPDKRCWVQRPAFYSWRQLVASLATAGVRVLVATPDGQLPSAQAFGTQRRPPAKQVEVPPLGGVPPHAASGGPRFRRALERAHEKYLSKHADFFDRKELMVDLLARAVVDCFEHVAIGPGGPWAFDEGVWCRASEAGDGTGGAVGRLTAALLGDRYRTSHETTLLAALARRSDLPTLTAHPITDRWYQFCSFRNGLLDWSTGALRPHDPAVMSTWQLPVDYDAAASCPRFRQFLSEVLPADMFVEQHGVAAWQEDLGYLLLPGNPFQVAFLLRGGGRNGKGVWLDVVAALAGSSAVSSLTLEDISGDRSRFRLAGLVESAVNLCGELDPKYLSSTATFKMLTGGDSLTVEEKYKASFRYTPWTTPVFSANQDFTSDDRSAAYFARWQARSFPNFIPEEGRDRYLADRIVTAELPGVAAAAIAGLQSLMARGRFRPTSSSSEQLRRFRRHSDHVMRFMDERLVIDPNTSTPRPAIFESYKHWRELEGINRGVTAHVLLEAVRQQAAEAGVELTENKVRGNIRVTGVGLAVDGGSAGGGGASGGTGSHPSSPTYEREWKGMPPSAPLSS